MGCLFFCAALVAKPADPQLLLGVDVGDHHSPAGARVADHEATLSAVVSTVRWCEFGEAAHAFVGGLVRDPGDSEGGARLAAAPLQHFGTALFNVVDPGPLLHEGTGRQKEGLGWCTDQPLVGQALTVLHVLQLEVL